MAEEMSDEIPDEVPVPVHIQAKKTALQIAIDLQYDAAPKTQVGALLMGHDILPLPHVPVPAESETRRRVSDVVAVVKTDKVA